MAEPTPKVAEVCQDKDGLWSVKHDYYYAKTGRTVNPGEIGCANWEDAINTRDKINETAMRYLRAEEDSDEDRLARVMSTIRVATTDEGVHAGASKPGSKPGGDCGKFYQGLVNIIFAISDTHQFGAGGTCINPLADGTGCGYKRN